MKKKLTYVNVKSLVSALLISAIILVSISSMIDFRVYAATSAYVGPAQIVLDPAANGSLGARFNVTVWITGVDDMKTWQVKMTYNHSMINITRWYEPTTNSSYVFYGKTTLAVPPPPKTAYYYVSPTEGYVGVGASLFPAPSVGEGFTGSGLLCILEFNVTATLPEGEIYTTPLKVDYPSDTYWMKLGESTKRSFDSYTPGEVTIIPEFIALAILTVLIVSTIAATALSKKGIRKSKLM